MTEEVKEIELKRIATFQEVADDLREKALDAYKKAMIAAEAKGTKVKDASGKVVEIRGWEPKDFLYAADCLKNIHIIYSKMGGSGPTQNKSGLAEMREAMRDQRHVEAITSDKQSG